MKKVINKTSLFFLILICNIGFSQQFTTNRNPVGMEHNLLFNATTRYLVTNTGPALDLSALFDGNMQPSYTTTAPTDVAPTVILIENLPGYHTQAGAWVGWTTRYWQASRFKIEGYDLGGNTWRTISDYSATDYNGFDFNVAIPYGGYYTKLKFTFYKGTGTNGYLGVSELFFIHPEATSPYQGLLASALNNWENISSNLCYNTSTGKVGIGTTTPDEKLTVKGKIHAQEVRVDLQGACAPDYVFQKYYTGKSTLKSDYVMLTLAEIESFTKKNHHLPNVPSAQEVQQNGVSLGTMSNVLLQKVEELTLYVIEQNKYAIEQNKKLMLQQEELERLKTENENYKSLAERLSSIEKVLKK